MTSTRIPGELLTSYDPELRKTLSKMSNQGLRNSLIIDEHKDVVDLRPPMVGNENAWFL